LRVIGGLDSGQHAARQRRRFGPKIKEKPVLREKISDETKAAMKSGDKLRLSTLRLVSAAIKNSEIEARTSSKQLTEDDLLGLLQKMIKQRQESVELYDKGGRKELAEQERGEIAIIQEFLPQQMGDAEAKAAIADIIAKEGATSVKDMGKVMAALKAAYAGKMDFGKASSLVKQQLSG
jgi:uncharacterized protein YqeY